MVTRVGLESYEVLAKHGAYDFEHENKQPFIVSIWAELTDNISEDDLNATLNYADLQKIIHKNIVDSKPVKLMETLCSNIITDLVSNKLISSISIRIEKPNAKLPFTGGLAVVEHEWARD
ncbi:MAG: dihydroneopterin aldolase [Candidatus Poseidoniaceae archaeon]|jgi:dihydroneopterin aldolase|nr:dihydroneopterin aldolase [Candidatus Poseidoniaceae archaeon]